MKIVVNKENFQRALGLVERVTSKNTALPILNNILLKTENGRLRVSATNLEVGITSTVGAKVTTEGQIAVPGRILADFVRSARDETVTLQTQGNTLTVDAGKFKTTILGFDAAEYPIIPKLNTANPRIIALKAFRRMITGITDCVAVSESRPELAGGLLSFQPDMTILAATDSFRLVERQLQSTNKNPGTLIVPRGTLMELARVLTDVDGDLHIVTGDNQVMFIHEDFEIVSRLIDGKYPDYHKVIPERALSKVLARKNDLEDAVKAAALFSSSISDVKIECGAEGVTVTAKNSSKGEAQTTVEGNLKGDPFEITLNHHYFLDGLKAIDTDKVVLEFTGKGSPFVLRPNDDKKEATYLIMPLRN